MVEAKHRDFVVNAFYVQAAHLFLSVFQHP
jgi:hypothetical protein